MLFVPSNNGMPPGKGGPELVGEARQVDIARARENAVFVIRADVAGRTGRLVAWGSSGIVDPNGNVLRTARELRDDLLFADLGTVPDAVRRADTIHLPARNDDRFYMTA